MQTHHTQCILEEEHWPLGLPRVGGSHGCALACLGPPGSAVWTNGAFVIQHCSFENEKLQSWHRKQDTVPGGSMTGMTS